MTYFKRISLFILTNIFIMFTITFVVQLLGIQPYLTKQGIQLKELAAFCLIWGFGGAFISLAMSRLIAKWSMGVKLIDPNTHDHNERWLLEKVYNLAKMANLPKMPQVGIYNSPEVNAFATGPSKSRSLVAVSAGLFQRMDQREIEGVLGHEISHISNGDMVTMTLLQGLINSFVMFLSRLIAFLVSQSVDERSRHTVRFIVTIALDIALTLLGSIVVASYSRRREYRADQGGAKLAGRDSMIAGLRKLQNLYEYNDPRQTAVSAFKISSKKAGGLLALLATHPPLEDRIRRLETGVTS